MKNNTHNTHFFNYFMSASLVILATEIMQNSRELLSSDGMISQYALNPFPVQFISPIMNLSFIQYLPWVILACALILVFKPARVIYFIAGLSCYLIAQRNQFLSGIDMAMISFVCLYFTVHGNKELKKSDSILLSVAISIVYLLSAIHKCMDPAWRSGEIILNLLSSNASYWSTVSFHRLDLFYFHLFSPLVILTEFLSPLLIIRKKMFIRMNYIYVIFHMIILLTLKIPHLSIFMIGFHLLLIRSNSLTPEVYSKS